MKLTHKKLVILTNALLNSPFELFTVLIKLDDNPQPRGSQSRISALIASPFRYFIHHDSRSCWLVEQTKHKTVGEVSVSGFQKFVIIFVGCWFGLARWPKWSKVWPVDPKRKPAEIRKENRIGGILVGFKKFTKYAYRIIEIDIIIYILYYVMKFCNIGT